MKTKLIPGCLLGGVMLLGLGCTMPSSTQLVPSSQAGQMQVFETGIIVKVRDVAIEGRRTNLGQYGGGVIGGAAAVPSGGVSGPGGALAVAGASVVGAIIGESVEELATRKRAQEITVQLKNGDMVTVVQAAPPDFQAGDHVQIMHSPAGARVAMNMEY